METFLRCTLEGGGKRVEVCFDRSRVTYAFGRPGRAPELTLSESVATVDYEPWSGVGRAKSEAVRFVNGGYGYQVIGIMDIDYSPGGDGEIVTTERGYLQVFRAGADGRIDFIDGTPIAEMSCDEEATFFPWGGLDGRLWLDEAKQELGLCWSHKIDIGWEACR